MLVAAVVYLLIGLALSVAAILLIKGPGVLAPPVTLIVGGVAALAVGLLARLAAGFTGGLIGAVVIMALLMVARQRAVSSASAS